MEFEVGYETSDSTYYLTYSSESDEQEEDGAVETTFLSMFPRDVVDCCM